jgi:inorganic pyrophosphatase
MADLSKLLTRDADGAIHVVVETPRGMAAKFKYEPKLGAFVFSRGLKTGLRYPYDWGFVPGTIAPDGDPLDAMILYDVTGSLGLVVPCRTVAVLEVEQEERGQRFRNDRVLFAPAKAPASRWMMPKRGVSNVSSVRRSRAPGSSCISSAGAARKRRSRKSIAAAGDSGSRRRNSILGLPPERFPARRHWFFMDGVAGSPRNTALQAAVRRFATGFLTSLGRS